ncbi:uncharacterized protein BX663DRAFT_551794 [Cokeromyces recurvatus]|uniref:uncharacterized protein n=1 Tax=Cokeromyces recurvatus TaxID=90255 RepID=UPI00221F5349|nr:uncharacterized protein BX663DRAFT_551794 [Cokeromyces recurvatus]KAI7902935.1 hypothetical protein BX663DRAFT_551794 [Cokeromyces recurvatus]
MPLLTTEQIDILMEQFNSVRQELQCTNCKHLDTFYKNGHNSKMEPPQPGFICKSCNKTYNAYNMLHIVDEVYALTTESNLTEDMELSGPSIQDSKDILAVNSDADLQSVVNRLVAELQQTKTALLNAQNEIQQLRQQFPDLSQKAASIDQIKSQTNTHTSKATSPWGDERQVQQLKQSLQAKHELIHKQRQQSAARFLQNPSDNQCFQYVYIHTKARIPIKQLRKKLGRLEINKYRILDVHYPTRNIVALLVHNDYVEEPRGQLTKFQITISDDFNPCDGRILKDPKLQHESPEQRDQLAFSFHCDRIERVLGFIRFPVKYSVARYIYAQNWISKTRLDEILASVPSSDSTDIYCTKKNSKQKFTNEDVDMSDSENNDKSL